MKEYQYKAINQKGEIKFGVIKANDENSARKQIYLLGLTVIHVKFSYLKTALKTIPFFQKKIPHEDFLIFNQQFQMMYSVGMPLLQSLEIISQQTTNLLLKETLVSSIKDLADGQSLKNSFSKYPHVFDSTYIGLIGVGEEAGSLETMLEWVNEINEAKAENIAKIKSALFYPKIVFGVMFIVFVVVVYFIIPRFADFYKSLKIELPGITRFTLGVSEFFSSPYFIIPFIILFCIYAYYQKKINKFIEKYWNMVSLKIPYFGLLLLQIELRSFSKVLEVLSRSGLTFLESLEIVKGTLHNQHIKDELDDMSRKIKAGKSISQAINETKSFPLFFKGLIAVGEQSGGLEKVLNKLGKYYKMQIDYKLDNLSKILEPLLLFIIFGCVLVLALSIFLPMWKITGAAK